MTDALGSAELALPTRPVTLTATASVPVFPVALENTAEPMDVGLFVANALKGKPVDPTSFVSLEAATEEMEAENSETSLEIWAGESSAVRPMIAMQGRRAATLLELELEPVLKNLFVQTESISLSAQRTANAVRVKNAVNPSTSVRASAFKKEVVQGAEAATAEETKREKEAEDQVATPPELPDATDALANLVSVNWILFAATSNGTPPVQTPVQVNAVKTVETTRAGALSVRAARPVKTPGAMDVHARPVSVNWTPFVATTYGTPHALNSVEPIAGVVLKGTNRAEVEGMAVSPMTIQDAMDVPVNPVFVTWIPIAAPVLGTMCA